MYQSGRAGEQAKKRTCKSPAKSGRVGISAYLLMFVLRYFDIPCVPGGKLFFLVVCFS